MIPGNGFEHMAWLARSLKWWLVLISVLALSIQLSARADTTGTPDEGEMEYKAGTSLAAKHPSHRVLQGVKFFTDASVYQAEPNVRKGTEGGLTVSKGNLSYFTLIKVDVRSLPREQRVKDAVLMLYVVNEDHGQPLDLIFCSLRSRMWSALVRRRGS